MPLAPHRDLTDGQLETCRRLDRPAPPLGSDRWSESGFDVFDYRHPGGRPPPGAPTSFRWRFQGDSLVGFFVYGWHDRTVPGKKKRQPKVVLVYGVLSDEPREVEARTLMEDRDAD